MKYILLTLLLFILTSCGGGGGSGNSSTSNSIKYATLFDSKVKGASYDAGDGITGITDDNGVFRYIEGKNIKFYINDIFIGEGYPVDKPSGVNATTQKIITPLTLANAHDDISNPKALKIVRFLMALDSDNNASNGININKRRLKKLKHIKLLDDNVNLFATFGNNIHIPTSTKAREHICQSLHRNDCDESRKVILPKLDLAHTFGIASEGTPSSYYYYQPASYAIDNNDSTFNHTSALDTQNWLQIKLPKGTVISGFMIKGRVTNVNRLEGAKVFLLTHPYDKNSTSHHSFANLKGTNQAQHYTLSTPQKANYFVVQARSGQNLHLRTVEIYGTVPNDVNYTISFIKHSYHFALVYDAKVNSIVGYIATNNYTNKDINFTIDSSLPFKIDTDGFITLKKNLNYKKNQHYDFNITINNKNSTDIANIKVDILSKNGVKQERWYGISGTTISSLTSNSHYHDNPDETKIVDTIDMYDNKKDNFGQKDTAVFRVPISGYYTFAIIGDDGTKLLMNNTTIASKASWGSYKDWNSAGKSNSFYLTKGEVFKLTAFLKEAGGVESISVGYKLTNSNDDFKIIPKKDLYIDFLTSTNLKPTFTSNDSNFTISKSSSDIGSKLFNSKATSLHSNNLTYSIIGNVPFSINNKGDVSISGSLEIKDYTFDINVSDGLFDTIKHVTIHSPINTQSLNTKKTTFLQKARTFTTNSDLDDLIQSYLDYAHEKEKLIYDDYMTTSISDDMWDYIKNHQKVKEALYASRFPANPYTIKNFVDFITKWKADGKSDAFIDKYLNVAIGLSINAKERGIFKEAIFGDTSEHITTDYTKLSSFSQKENNWKNNLNFDGISYYKFRSYLKFKYNLTNSESDSLWNGTYSLKRAFDDGYSLDQITPDIRSTYNISFDELNLYRVAQGLSRLDCSASGNPCDKIQTYITNENNSTITKNYILAHFKEYKTKVGLINARDNMADELRGELSIVPKNKNFYELMSFYDLADWKISLDNIPPQDFHDDEPNWPLFDYSLSKEPWQLLALEQSAQKQECNYVKERFFETDKSNLEDSYPPNAIDNGKKKDKRFIQYTTYTWAYDNPEVWYRNSNWSPHRTVYRILQDGGVCGRQSTMGQHVNECLNRPSIGVGQPGHRAWVGVYFKKGSSTQLQTNIGYKVGSRESATPHSHLIYNQYTSSIRETGLERFTGVVTGVSATDEHTYNQSMILQHIAKIMQNEDSSSVEALLRKAIDIVPQNTDAWYQLALYYASKDEPQKIISLAKEYRDKEFFFEPSNRKGADNLKVVTGKNIAFTILKAPSIYEGKGEKAQWGIKQLWNYLDNYEENKRSLRSYRNQNRYLAKYYLKKLNDESAFDSAVEDLFDRFLNNSYSGSYLSDYFRGVDFADINKTKLFDSLQNLTDTAQISDSLRSKIYKDILGRNLTTPLAQPIINDICIDSNLSKCQSLQIFELNAKALYITVDKKIGEDTEVNPANRGKNSYSTLTISAIDDTGKDIDIKVRIAKIATNQGIKGKLLKINDPTEVETNTTKIVAWIDPNDNSLENKKIYSAQQRVILKVKKRVQNNEESMGNIILNIKDLIKGHSITFNGTDFSTTYKDNSTSIYFVTLESNIGPTKGVWWDKGTTTLNIPVFDEDGNTYTVKLKATNNSNYKMNTGLLANWDNTLKIVYDSNDNNTLPTGKRYKTKIPFVIDAKMWHNGGKVKDRLYINMNLEL